MTETTATIETVMDTISQFGQDYTFLTPKQREELLNQARADILHLIEWAHSEGYEEGKEESDDAYELGAEEGRIEGYDEGQGDGYDEGYREGKECGYEDGKLDGYEDGYQEGLEAGRAENGDGV